ncbi:hypothetical protein JDW15_06435 [Aerococcaceae bacterium zg-ZJ1578]|uniref:hypothetical protein n=1 Tax=Aerococcaceae bacterium zg-252 TaxID=2796928 RepID=UPI001A1D2C31|nr:hypothetical protein [Aerococcaceae bacterium zg-1578]
METSVSTSMSSLDNFEQDLLDLKLSLFEECNVDVFEESESELGFMFSKGGGSRPRPYIEGL